MSADNTIAILKTPSGKGGFEYRVIHAQAIENIYWQHDDGNPLEVMRYFGKCEVLTSEINALKIALDMEKEILNDDFGILEYGIRTIELPHPFSYYKRKGTRHC